MIKHSLLGLALAGLLWCMPAAAQVGSSMQEFQAGPVARDVTPNSASLWWVTKTPMDSIITYGTDPQHETRAQGPGNVTEHNVQVTGLQPGTKYYFQVVSNTGSSLFSSVFTTPAANEPANSLRITNGPNIESITDHNAVIAWSTNVPSSSTVHYGTSNQSLNQKAQAPWGGTTHRVTLNNLQPNTTYYVDVESSQAQGTGTAAYTGYFSFQTTAPGQQAAYHWPH